MPFTSFLLSASLSAPWFSSDRRVTAARRVTGNHGSFACCSTKFEAVVGMTEVCD